MILDDLAAPIVLAPMAGGPSTVELAAAGAASSLVLPPARLTALRHALEAFVSGRDEAEWLRDEDREPLSVARALLWPLADLCEDALRAALAAADTATAG